MIGKITQTVATVLATSTIIITNNFTISKNEIYGKNYIETQYDGADLDYQEQIYVNNLKSGVVSKTYRILNKQIQYARREDNASYIQSVTLIDRKLMPVASQDVSLNTWEIQNYRAEIPHFNEIQQASITVYSINQWNQKTQDYINGEIEINNLDQAYDVYGYMIGNTTAPNNATVLQTQIDDQENYFIVNETLNGNNNKILIVTNIDYGSLTVEEADFVTNTTQNVTTPYSFNIESSYTAIIDENTTYEVIDIPDLMFSILGMPFSWISTAFNLTLFPDTPYSINISGLLMTLIAALILGYLIKRIIK